ncbi:MAG: SPOR domain-containing protein [Glaciecola sp.]|nr:SPOR domain-containing protein [Glaciecola sp.]
MNSALQNRLVGTVIIVALAVIFLPDLLDGKKQTKQDIQVSIPKVPEVLSMQQPSEVDMEALNQQAQITASIELEIAVDDEPSTELESSRPTMNIPTTNNASSELNMQPQNPNASLAYQTQILIADPQDSAGWVVQLGSFRHQKNVRELINVLEKAGYRTFSRPVQTPSGELTKVFVGPEIEQEKLKMALPHLNEITKLKGRLTPFTIK